MTPQQAGLRAGTLSQLAHTAALTQQRWWRTATVGARLQVLPAGEELVERREDPRTDRAPRALKQRREEQT